MINVAKHIICEGEQQDAHLISLFVTVVLSSTCFEQIVHHQEVISVHAAYPCIIWRHDV